MSLQSITLPASIPPRVKRKLRQLSKDGYFHNGDKDIQLEATFYLSIQNLRVAPLTSLNFGGPEGIRVLVMSKAGVVGAADFLYSGKRLRLSHVIMGSAVERLLMALNKLEKNYARTPTKWYVEILHFLPLGDPYLVARSASKKEYYSFGAGRLKKKSGETIKKQINHIAKQQNQK